MSDEDIARYAYRLYEERGRADGHALDDWLAAERALRGEPPADAYEKAARLVAR